jgi:hypothetical protein
MRERARIAFILAMVIVVMGIVGRMEMEAMHDESYLECAAMLANEDWDGASCAPRWSNLSVIARQMWGEDGDPETMWRDHCGFVMDSESVGMVPAMCETESEIAERMDAIRSVRSGFRTWEDGR